MQEIDDMSVLRDMIRTWVFSTNYFLSSDMYVCQIKRPSNYKSQIEQQVGYIKIPRLSNTDIVSKPSTRHPVSQPKPIQE